VLVLVLVTPTKTLLLPRWRCGAVGIGARRIAIAGDEEEEEEAEAELGKGEVGEEESKVFPVVELVCTCLVWELVKMALTFEGVGRSGRISTAAAPSSTPPLPSPPPPLIGLTYDSSKLLVPRRDLLGLRLVPLAVRCHRLNGDKPSGQKSIAICCKCKPAGGAAHSPGVMVGLFSGGGGGGVVGSSAPSSGVEVRVVAVVGGGDVLVVGRVRRSR
jgi:hypothetical protein